MEYTPLDYQGFRTESIIIPLMKNVSYPGRKIHVLLRERIIYCFSPSQKLKQYHAIAVHIYPFGGSSCSHVLYRPRKKTSLFSQVRVVCFCEDKKNTIIVNKAYALSIFGSFHMAGSHQTWQIKTGFIDSPMQPSIT